LSGSQKSPQRPLSFGVSAVLHATILLYCATSASHTPARAESRRSIFTPEEKKRIVWYSFKQRLPEVSPGDATERKPPAKGNALQAISAKPKNPDNSKQFVWVPEPRLKLPHDLSAPNVIAVKAPELPAPQRPMPKQFRLPESRLKQVAQPAALDPEPSIVISRPVPLPQITPKALPKPEPRKFVAPPGHHPAVDRRLPELPSAPSIQAGGKLPDKSIGVIGAQPALPKPEPRKFVAPLGRPGGGSGQPQLADLAAPPEIQTAGASHLPGDGIPGSFGAGGVLPPPTGNGTGSGSGSNGSTAGSGTVTAAIVGIRPSNSSDVRPPEGTRMGQVQTGVPNGRGMGGGGGSSGIVVPGLSVSGTPGGSPGAVRPPPVQTAGIPRMPTPGVPVPPRSFPSMNQTALSVPYWPNARTLSPAIEAKFRGRVVYATVIPAPARASGTPDWIIWFAEERVTPVNTRPVMRAPMPVRVVPPSFDASSPRKLQVSGVLRKDGHIDSLMVLAAANAPAAITDAARGVMGSLAQWVFTPAVCNGAPVEVEVLIDIPVRY